MTALYIGVGVYFACMIAIGFIVRSKVKTAEGYLVAGRSFGFLQNSMALTACFLGGSLVLAVPGLTLKFGIWNDEAMWGGNCRFRWYFLFVDSWYFLYAPAVAFKITFFG